MELFGVEPLESLLVLHLWNDKSLNHLLAKKPPFRLNRGFFIFLKDFMQAKQIQILCNSRSQMKCGFRSRGFPVFFER